MKFNIIFEDIVNEQSILKTSVTKPIVDAIKNRNPITFMYNGPRKPKKSNVRPGTRVKAEVVALGLNKKGRLIIRAFVKPPSVSKRGFDQHGWRTFIISRMSNIKIHNDETFNEKRPGYSEGDDKSMSITYVTTDWTTQPKKPKVTKPALPSEKPVIKTVPKPIEPIEKPEKIVEPTVTPEKQISDIPKKEKPKPIEPEVPAEVEPEVQPELKSKEKPEKLPQTEPENDEENEENKLQETIKRIKTLIIY